MELENPREIHSSENCTVILGEYNGRQYIKKTEKFSKQAAEIIAEINSPYISRIVEIGDDYIITEYADGGDLSKVKLSRSQIFQTSIELCSVLSELHKNGIIHRDIKPSNIIWCNDEHIKLIDFNSARIKKAVSDKDTQLMGTEGFAPPEQFGFAQTNECSDIYAFGVTVKMLLGSDFEKSSYKNVIRKCMRFNPDERYSSFEKVKAALMASKIVPAVVIPLCSMGAIAAFVFTVNAQLNSKPTYIDYSSSEASTSTNSSVMSSSVSSSSVTSSIATSSSVTSSSTASSSERSSSVTSSTISSSVSNSSVSTKSSSSTSSSARSSSVSSSKSSSVASSSMKSSSVSSSSSSTYYISSKVSSTKEPLAVPQDRTDYPIPWEVLSLPEGFPQLRNGFEFYTVDRERHNNKLRFLATWNTLSDDEINYITQTVGKWLNKPIYYSLDGEGEERWYAQNIDFEFCLFHNPQDEKFYFNLFSLDENYRFPINLKHADETVTNNKERDIDWEDIPLTIDIPQLSERISFYNYGENTTQINWKYMEYSEAESIVKKIIEGLDTEYEYEIDFYSWMYVWQIHTNINGSPVTYKIDFFHKNSNYKTKLTITT